ncbi:SDR family oxidoreductase [Pseudooceanicola sediminis]|uniref:SDR family oxidoreductase n=1 Tax=Pseudooceanicola sediminis TaxID=2211117 RepID=A0A399IX97_9RHOB|nr:SDR family NAD(P)-dependent oxidoreductase [Pseudooceanicola sediminis]KAA2312577.1 SDR family oxidoreductase [Puniceibacterium sp. HSS470]RII37584.1 SDR family oxidoreductase [Pseudooceanicola sediminis]
MTPHTLNDLSGKVALVTGGATGIGRMAAEGLVAAGARVLIASRKAEACAAVAEDLNALGLPGTAEGFGGDVGTEAGITALSRDLRARTDKLHILMNNAGRTWGAPMGDFPYEAWGKVLGLNVTGMFHLTQTLLDLLRAAATDDDPARIVNVGSVMGEIPKGQGAYSYAVSKSAVHHMTRVLANELAADRITVNAIAPGPFMSKMMAFAIGHEEGRAKTAASVPLGRVGREEDIAGTLQFLCGRGGSYITGAIIPLSGGMQVATAQAAFLEDDA